MTRRAVSIGIAKPMPCAPPPQIAVLIPISRPSAFSNGPPELPGLIEASVWSSPWKGRPPSLLRVRSSAEITPVVTVLEKPKGLPIAITGSPTIRSWDSPGFVYGNVSRCSIWIRSTARSLLSSAPTTSAAKTRPSDSATRIPRTPSITWALVSTCPLRSKITPEPRVRPTRERGS